MKKILYVASTMSHIENFHRDYINALREMGHKVYVMANGQGADYNVPFEKSFFSEKNKFARKEIKKILKAEQFDCILLNTTLAAFHTRLALKNSARPRVVNLVHGYLFSSDTGFVKTKILKFCEKFVAKKTDSVIVMNREDAEYAEKYKLTKGKVYFTRGMGVKFRPLSGSNIRKRLNLEDKFILTFVGELSGRKNQRFLIMQMPEILKSIPNAHLCLVGDGDKREECTELINSLSLSNSVTLLGNRQDVSDILSATDLYVSSSIIEGMPFNVLEAMSLGLVSVLSDIKGHRDICADNEYGFLFKYGSAEQFVDLVKKVYRKEIGIDPCKIKSRYKEYSFEEVFESTLAAVTEALDL